jgi:spermidine synthase
MKNVTRVVKSGGTFIRRRIWPPRVNKLQYLWRRTWHRWKPIYAVQSAISGTITVSQLGRERRLDVGDSCGGVTQSVIFTKGSWAELEREYWGRALRPPFPIPARPRVLILGLGGGTMAHLAHRTLQPESMTVVELDPVMVETARANMGVDSIPGLDIRIEDALVALNGLKNSAKFDLIVEDIFCRGFPTKTDDYVRGYIADLADVLAATGTVTFNRWFRSWSGKDVDSDQTRLVRLLNERFVQVIRARIRQRMQNELIFATGQRGH